MRSEVIGDFQEPFGAVFGVVFDMALASRQRLAERRSAHVVPDFGRCGAIAFHALSCENVHATSDMPDRAAPRLSPNRLRKAIEVLKGEGVEHEPNCEYSAQRQTDEPRYSSLTCCHFCHPCRTPNY